ncbi:MAG: putative 2OG-Fe(II) oxygenase [Steroidobacteraceae bacterium]
MVSPVIVVTPTFAVPLGETSLDPCDALNRELEALFLQRETDEFRNPTPSHLPQQETFESRFNLFSWPEPCVQQLRAFMLAAIGRMVLQVSAVGPEELARLQMHNHTWFHITRFGGSFVSHNHPLASWSGVYCVRAGEQVPDQPASGVLRLFDTRPGADAFRDPANSRLRRSFAVGHRELRLQAGQLVIFPSYLFHEVAPFYGRDTRITVATNCWFV